MRKQVKLTAATLLLLLLSIGCFSIGQSMAAKSFRSTQRLKELRFSISFEEQNLHEAIAALSKAHNLRFSYNPNDLKKYRIQKRSFNDTSLGHILEALFASTDLTFSEDNRSLIIYKKRTDQSKLLQPQADAGTEKTSEFMQTVITGQVTDEANHPLSDVTVSIKGTNRVVSTDASGRFRIEGEQGAILVFSIIGYQTQEIALAEQNNVNVILRQALSSLDEVIVVGYGTTRKSDLVGSVATIKGDAIKEMPVVSVDQAIQARVPGVMVSQASAAPGGGLSIRVRGANSINSGSEPLYVIDGFPIYPDNGALGTGGNRRPANAMASLNPNEIESIEILKDASATAIYGSRGSNGVVLITTKRGNEGATAIDYDGSYSFQNIANPIEVLNGADYARYINLLEESQGGSPRFTQEQIAQIGDGTNWRDAILRTGGMSNHQLSFTGGTATTRYAFVANYMDNTGIIENTEFKRYGFRLNLDNDFLNGKATLSNSWSYNRTGSSNTPTDRGGPGGIIITALGLDPTVAVFDEYGDYNYPSYDQRFLINPLAEAREGYDHDNANRLFGTTALTFRIIDGLQFKTSIGADVMTAERTSFYNSYTYIGRQYNRQLEKANRNLGNLLNENILSFNRQFGNRHTIDLTAGYTYQKELNQFQSNVTRDLPSDNVSSVNLNNGNQPLVPTSSRVEWALQSYLFRANYNFDDRYLLTATVRRDGSSKFGPNNKWATFPSVAVGWRLINEPFVKNTAFADLFDEFKFRVSYGITGNSQIPVYRSVSGLVPYNYVFGGDFTAGYGPNRIPNASLKWESTAMFNAGIDLVLLENRLSFTADVFSNRTDDLLLDVSIPQSTGFNSVMLNSGSLTNKGVEFSATYQMANKSTFFWDVSGNISFLKNRIDNLGLSTPFFTNSTSGHLGVLGSWVEAGYPIGVWRGYRYTGLFQSDAEGENYSALAGYPMYEDVDGNGTYTADDFVVIGDPNPDFTWGLNSSVRFKDFDFSLLIRGVHGNDVRNLQQSEMGDGVQKINQIGTILEDSWRPDNTDASRPVIDGRRDFISFRRSSFFIEDGSFIRLQNVSLGYTLPLKTKFIRRARLYASGQNLFLITNYSGFDPEVNNQGQNNLNRGDDYDAYPRAKMYTLGVNVGF